MSRSFARGPTTSAATSADIRLGGDAAASGESGRLFDREEVLGVVQADLPRHVGLQKLAGLGEVEERGAQGQQPKASRRVEFGPLIGVEQHAQPVLRLLAGPGGKDVHQAVDEAGGVVEAVVGPVVGERGQGAALRTAASGCWSRRGDKPAAR